MINDQSTKDGVFRWVTSCEMLCGQPESYYHAKVQNRDLNPFDLKRYHILIAGLNRQVYRSAFGIDAFSYSNYFRETEREISELLDKQGVQHNSMMMLYDHSKRFVMIFSTPENVSAHDVAEIVSGCFNRLYARVFDMSKTPYRNYTVLSEEIHGYENLSRTFRELDSLSCQQFFDMRTMIMTPSLLESERTPVSREQIHEDITLLRTAIRERDERGAGMVYGALMDHLYGARDFELLQGSLHALRSLADGILASCGRELDEPEGFSIDHYPTFEYLRAGVRDKLMGIMASLPDGPAMSAPVLEAVRYIRHHFTEDVSLADVARHIGMSQSWLTKRFNQECGASIPQYLMQVRMERAKKMLQETNLLVFEIANAVGFENPRYFVSVFKKAMGLTPTEYREQEKQA